MTPGRGDTVQVTVEGEYSHQGNENVTTGFHIVKVRGFEVALPPNTKFEVVKRWKPAEPPHPSIVKDTDTGHTWELVLRHHDIFRRWWECANPDGYTYTRFANWEEVLGLTDGGRNLRLYQPAGMVAG